ncbi:allulose-6-phosphate 3-epimerase [Anaerofilum sp. BX8]|uniref:Allulose-6-phosphate 3-epimerase n=1 Tax=Anaerofilum hominis TaxID=2763016 RepID=A0A923IFG2_9FIRM|nr:D-allulose 6-phosphate 3-epimerase [Anaerofilum hominis]MBC5581897.1 allulose-6-phosphate 3-epimerase [Anaerofilum hominis]
MKREYLSPSLMCMDFLHAEEQLKIFEKNFDALHFDIMDGHFCKNLALSPAFLRVVSSTCNLPVDAHLMATKPDDFLVDAVAEAGASCISLHAETINRDGFRMMNKIEKLGCKKGLVLNPSTPLDCIKYLLGRIDLLTVMTVDVGFAGQSFIFEMLDKIREARRMREENGWHYLIQVDGGCRQEYYRMLHDAGAEAYILGNAGLFSLDPDLQIACNKMRRQFSTAIAGGEG